MFTSLPMIDPPVASGEVLVHAWKHLQLVQTRNRDGENPDDPSTVRAMPIVINVPKNPLPVRHDLLAAAATAVVACCLDARAGQPDSAFALGLKNWYGCRIRKVTRRARNTKWEKVQNLPGVTATVGRASARAFVPCAIPDTPHDISSLQIKGTDLPSEETLPQLRTDMPLIVVDASLSMTVGKAAAQVGHASMLLAAAQPVAWVAGWAATHYQLAVRELPHDDFLAFSSRADAVPVVDAGYTEVAPGSVTCVGLPHP